MMILFQVKDNNREKDGWMPCLPSQNVTDRAVIIVKMGEHNYLTMSGMISEEDVPESQNMTREVFEDTVDDDIIWDMPPDSNVEVDQTPLQLMIKKNKECKYY